MASTSLGYLVPSGNAISLDDYDLVIDGKSVVHSDENAQITWTDRSDLQVSFILTLDLNDVLSQCGFNPINSANLGQLAATVNWKSTGSGLHGASPLQSLSDGENVLSFTLDSTKLGGELIIKPSIVLENNPDPDLYPLAPRRTGSRLWSSSISVRLEGTGSQFPTTALDFAKNYIEPPDALWQVRIPGDLSGHFSSSVRLYLNTGHPRITDYLKDPSAKDQLELHNFVRADVIIQLLTFAFNSDLEQLKLDAEEPGTLAEALLEIHSTYFPQTTIESNKDNFLTDPGFLSSAVIAKTFSRRSGKESRK
ncbi:hypothetical protein [Corynebacterium lubricantis]|uniref:hypothetical protein n=1 Tax=Corynebacterium lubricantis TaxID=541095 RepID=UPI00039FF141|nr:hypothetical protein [Corynebacterium lubricantis]